MTGIPFVLNTPLSGNKGWGRVGDWSPSIDRIDSSKGYTPENCQMVVWIYNRCKNNSTDENVLLMAAALVRRKEG